MKYILNISIYLSLHAMISMWSVFYTYTGLTYATLSVGQISRTMLAILDLFLGTRKRSRLSEKGELRRSLGLTSPASRVFILFKYFSTFLHIVSVQD